MSTDGISQTSSYELQKNHYTDVIDRHAGWKLYRMYADEGISGTSLAHRDEFVRMIEDCKAGNVNLIVTKSVSRFARNILDCIGHVRELAALKKPVGVFFETENIYTLNPNSEMSLSFIATLAQEESHNKSEIMNSSIEMRFRRGIFLTPPLLGYDHDENGNLFINTEESKTVRLIFFMYLYGYSCQQIADTLTNLGRRTKKNNTTWSPGSVLQTLQNERHCGDVLSRKTFTPNYLNHRAKKNKNDRNQYRKRGHHDAIISRDDFIAVQRLISNVRYGNKGILPKLNVIPDGALKGFVSINPRWAGFKARDYRFASASVYEETDELPDDAFQLEAPPGDFDLRGFEIARSQFFDSADKLCATFSPKGIVFSTRCVRKIDETVYVEMLIHPIKCLLAVRACSEQTRNAVKWAKLKDDLYYPRSVGCAAYIGTLYELFDWKNEYKYRVRGVRKQKGDETAVIFDLNESETFISPTAFETATDDAESQFSDLQPLTFYRKNVIAFSSSMTEGIGNSPYAGHGVNAFGRNDHWNLRSEGTPYSDSADLQVTEPAVIESNIQQIIGEIRQEGALHG